MSDPVTGVRAAVLGKPVAHSLSPVLHAAAYQALGLEDWSYTAMECGEADLPGLLASLGPEWAGLSLTMPLKRAVLPLLDETEPLAAATGGANTVVLRAGRRLGYNTDVPGMVTALRQAGAGAVSDALVLGAGATACSALAALRELGCAQVTVAVREPGRAQPLLEVARGLGAGVSLVSLAAAAGTGWDALVSTVPAAAAAAAGDKIAAGQLRAGVVFDVVYDPWPTPLATAATAAGTSVVSGYDLLVAQAGGQVELMTGRSAPVTAMRAAGQAELDRRAAAAR